MKQVLGLLVLALVLVVPTLAAAPQEDRVKGRIVAAEAVVAGLTNSTITLQVGNRTVELVALGTWLVTGEELGLYSWEEASAFLEVGESVKATAARVRGRGVLLKLSKPAMEMIRLPVRRLASRLRRGRSVALRCEVVKVGRGVVAIKRSNLTALLLLSKAWIKAGEGEVSWEGLTGELSLGDELWVYGKAITLRKGLAGYRALIAPITIIDLSGGAAFVRASSRPL